MNSSESFYLQRADNFKTEADTLKRKYESYAFVRLAYFLPGLGLCVYLFTLHWAYGTIATLLFLNGFYRFVLWHQKIQQAEKHNRHLEEINRYEADVVGQHKYDHFNNGQQYLDVAHPYTLDLDIFGDYSVFQYLNRTSTALGRGRLARYLSQQVSLEVIKQRQEAIRELKGQLDWRQHLQAYGQETEDDLDHIRLLKQWLKDPAFISNKPFYIWSYRIMPIWMTIGIVLSVFYLPWQIILLFLLYPAYILKTTLEDINKTHNKTTHAENTLAFYAKLIQHIEEGNFSSPKLKALQASFKNEGQDASKAIKRLSYIISQLNLRYNVFAIFFNLFALWDLRWVAKLEKWKKEQQAELPIWFESLSEFESLSSFGNLYHNNPEWIFPAFQETPKFNAVALGHPLIKKAQRVCNDLSLPTDGHIKLVTGSNMAGKSTFLRTVGLNIVLASAGSPVCAERMTLPLLKVYTSMRTQDALHESTSSFYAELKRLKFIIEAVENGENIFFLLDEILKGTNSKDRHTGAKALIRQLIKSKGSGIIATHDLELGLLEATANGAIENLRMEVEIKDGQLDFDYKLKKGVSESFNATLLMQNMGIRIENAEN